MTSHVDPPSSLLVVAGIGAAWEAGESLGSPARSRVAGFLSNNLVEGLPVDGAGESLGFPSHFRVTGSSSNGLTESLPVDEAAEGWAAGERSAAAWAADKRSAATWAADKRSAGDWAADKRSAADWAADKRSAADWDMGGLAVEIGVKGLTVDKGLTVEMVGELLSTDGVVKSPAADGVAGVDGANEGSFWRMLVDVDFFPVMTVVCSAMWLLARGKG